MKIKVKPEGGAGIYLPDKDSLKEYVRQLGKVYIHNFIPTGMMMLGADHHVDSVLEDIERADRLAIFTDSTANMGHSLALIRAERLECYDLGSISEADLEIT